MTMDNLLRKTRFVLLITLIMAFAACNDEGEDMDLVATGSLTVMDQVLTQNMVHVSNISVEENGWVVVHAAANSGPQVPEIISEPIMVEAGSTDDIMIEITDFTNLADGSTLYVMLHTDNGIAGEYEFDGVNALDNPMFDEDGNMVMTAIAVMAPSVTVTDQVVNENMVTMDEVVAAVDGWLVIHADNGDGTPGAVIGQTMVMAGVNSDVMVDLGNETFAGGEMLFPMLHVESPADGVYGFPENGDGPEVFGEDVVVVGFETMAPTGVITVSDQVIQENTLTVSQLESNATGWLVVHASNAANDGPEVPGIISTPVQVSAGMNMDVEIMLTEPVSVGDVLYVMLHTENGEIGSYEFDGANGFDGPITTQSITVLDASGSAAAN